MRAVVFSDFFIPPLLAHMMWYYFTVFLVCFLFPAASSQQKRDLLCHGETVTFSKVENTIFFGTRVFAAQVLHNIVYFVASVSQVLLYGEPFCLKLFTIHPQLLMEKSTKCPNFLHLGVSRRQKLYSYYVFSLQI